MFKEDKIFRLKFTKVFKIGSNMDLNCRLVEYESKGLFKQPQSLFLLLIYISIFSILFLLTLCRWWCFLNKVPFKNTISPQNKKEHCTISVNQICEIKTERFYSRVKIFGTNFKILDLCKIWSFLSFPYCTERGNSFD